MKRIKLMLALSSLLIASLVFVGCEKNKEEQTGSLNFGLSSVSENLKSLDNQPYDVQAALVTITGENGEMFYEKEYVEFYSFGGSFVTKSLKLDVGRYLLSEFMLVDSSGTVTWATPVEGSELASMVNDPLPIEFRVVANSTTHLSPEVIRVSDYNPDDFGYVNFSVQFVTNLCVGIMFETQCLDWFMLDTINLGNNQVMPPYYPSKVMVFSDGMLISETVLYPGENQVLIPRGKEMYRLQVIGCDGQVCFNDIFGLDELAHFSCRNGEMLHIHCEPYGPDVIITPEELMDPTIEQGVYGFITRAPINDTLWTDDIYLEPMVADVYIYQAMLYDSLYLPPPMDDCRVYPDMSIQPLAIVRSNSGGFYQLPLEEGVYTYILKTPSGFYVDATLNSITPGYFKITAGELTNINLHYVPCIYY